MEVTKTMLFVAGSILLLSFVCVHGMEHECAQYTRDDTFEDACNQTEQVCEPGFYAMIDAEGCFDMCTKCSNGTYTDGYNNCSQCIACSECEKQGNSSCVTQCPKEEIDDMCSEVPEIKHGSYTCTMTPNNKKGSECSVSCEEGYHENNKTITCQEDLNWSDTKFPECEDDDDDDEDFPLLMVIIIAAAGGFCLVVFLLLLVLFCQRRKMLCFSGYKKASTNEEKASAPPGEMDEMA